jgi:hypothetical protein
MSFTPGPWAIAHREVFGSGDAEGSASIVKWDDDGDGYSIIFESVDYSDQESKSNANIASISPEILDALEKLVLFVPPKPSNAIALNNAYRVIAKARGEGG